MSQKVALMIIPETIGNKLAQKTLGIGRYLLKFFPQIETDIIMTDLDTSATKYCSLSFINATLMGSIFGFLMGLLFWSQGEPVSTSVVLGGVIGFGIWFMFMFLFARYPNILAENKAQEINKDLVFALKDLSMHISAGVSLYDAIVEVAKGNYQATSREFKHIVHEVNSGKPISHALEILAIRSKSEYMKRTSWQIVNTLKSGANLTKTLQRIIDDLSAEQRTRIQNYARELNLWSLLYMMFAVAVPSIGSTMLVILSSFAGFGVTRQMFIMFVIICFIIQYVLIGFVKSRRPVSNI